MMRHAGALPETTATPAAQPARTARKIAGLSALVVAGAVGLIMLFSRPTSSQPVANPVPADPAPAAERVPATSASSVPTPAHPIAPSAPAPSAPAFERSSPAGRATEATGALRDEIALIDGARAALAAGSPAKALSLLERYRVRHPRGMLLPEALAMRIEAIDRSGEHARARSQARAFLAQYPNSPLAQRVTHIAR